MLIEPAYVAFALAMAFAAFGGRAGHRAFSLSGQLRFDRLATALCLALVGIAALGVGILVLDYQTAFQDEGLEVFSLFLCAMVVFSSLGSVMVTFRFKLSWTRRALAFTALCASAYVFAAVEGRTYLVHGPVEYSAGITMTKNEWAKWNSYMAAQQEYLAGICFYATCAMVLVTVVVYLGTMYRKARPFAVTTA